MILPTKGVPVIVAIALKAESDDWHRRGVTPDEAQYRHVYMRTLERFGVECPHPVKTDMSQFYDGVWECKTCRVRWVPKSANGRAKP